MTDARQNGLADKTALLYFGSACGIFPTSNHADVTSCYAYGMHSIFAPRDAEKCMEAIYHNDGVAVDGHG